MSGREQEPISAFFPAIDRNLMRDLDRQLRAAPAGLQMQPVPAPEPAPVPSPIQGRASSITPDGAAGRPSIATIVEAVEQAAHSIATMTARIQELEGQLYDLQTAHHQLDGQLTEAGDRIDELEASLRAESARADDAERHATDQTNRAASLERDLSLAHADLTKVAETISASLGTGQHGFGRQDF